MRYQANDPLRPVMAVLVVVLVHVMAVLVVVLVHVHNGG
jgi:hypothetical protein